MPALDLPIDGRSVAAARSFLRNALDGRQATSTDDAILMMSELVSNAVRHAHTLLHVMVSITQETLRVEVGDDEPALPVAPNPKDDATSGRGLRIVGELADHWGIAPNAPGKTVWFELHLGREGMSPVEQPAAC
jgi:anti-sigma regulatory factor (Ser/Thr protein kinase)